VTYTVEVVLRDRDVATSEVIQTGNAPRDWTELEVEEVLREILRAIERARDPGAPAGRPVVLRGFSWIVEPSDGGVVIALEIPMGAAVAGPFDADQSTLDALITSALKRQPRIEDIPTPPTIH
jgi:hypothetical protein